MKKGITANDINYTSEMLDTQLMIIKDNLPEGFLQTRRIKLNYQTLRHIYFDRKNHRQPEFREYSKWIEMLPYAEYLIIPQKNIA